MNARPLLLLVSLLAAVAVAAPYKWVDKDGKVHYSDQPPPEGVKAEQVKLPALTEISAEPVPESASAEAPEATPEAVAAGTYTEMAISSPKDQETLRGSGIGLTIGVRLEPALMKGDSIEYTLDGKVVPASIPYVERGQHTIGARVVGADGSTKISASPITVFVFQNISEAPQNAPPKPKPKPKTP